LAIRHPSHELRIDIEVFYDSDIVPTKPKDFDCDFSLQSNSTHKVPIRLHEHVKLKFDDSHYDVYRCLAIQSLAEIRYFITFNDELSQYIYIYFV
jgi:hypothetical protein